MAALNVLCTTVAVLLSAGALVVLQPSVEGGRQSPGSPYVPSYIERGNRVQEHYDGYTKRLHAYYESLLAALKSSAPELVSLLVERPNPLQHGYQILPRIIADTPPLTRHPRAQSAQYSWPWTDHLIDRALTEIGRSAYQLNRALELEPGIRQAAYQQLAGRYRHIREQQQNIDAHIQYNRLWQGAIGANRLHYDRETVLHDQALKRQEIIEIFKARQTAAVASAHGTINPEVVASLNELGSGLSARKNLLGREIDAAADLLNIPEYVRVEQQNRLWIVHVPFYTDIDDGEFVQSAKEAIEKTWHLRSGDNEFRIELHFSSVSPEYLYGTSKPPQNGNRMDIQEHVELFPADGAILTTGAVTTHVRGRAIILGPHEVARRVLAHEFGHVLGFRDVYFRGYKNLREDGFQLMELVADPNDIMGAAATGAVLRRHYEKIISLHAAQNCRNCKCSASAQDKTRSTEEHRIRRIAEH